jgi:preprotein translocase subunit Sss1
MSVSYRLKALLSAGVLLFVSTFQQVQAHNLHGANLAAALVYHIDTTKLNDKEIPSSSSKKVIASSKVSAKSIKKKSRRLDTFKREQGKELLRASTQMGLGIFLIGGIGYMIGGAEALNASTLMSPLISGMLVNPLKDIGNKLCTLFTPYLASPAIRRGMDYKKHYEKRRHKLTESMNVFLGTTISKYMHWVEKFGYEAKETEKAIEEILDFPLAPKPLAPDLVSITEFIKNYPEDVRLSIGDFVISAIMDSEIEKLEKKSVPLMFVGPPGTGKTYLASQIGDLLGMSVQIIDISKYKSVNGQSFWSSGSEVGVIVDTLLGGKTPKGNFSNKIIVLDEIDKALAKDENGRFMHESGSEVMSLLYTILETQEITARLARYGGATYDISQLKIILVGNRTFSELFGKENAMALESRVNLIRFSGFKDEQKLAIAKDYIKKVCISRSIPYADIDEAIIQEIVKTDTQAGNQGVRIMLKVVDQYLRILQKGMLIGQVAGLPPVTFDIKKAYETEQGENLEKNPSGTPKIQ